MTDEVGSAARAAISFGNDGGSTKVMAGPAVTAEMQPLTGETGRVITVADGALAVLLGTPAE